MNVIIGLFCGLWFSDEIVPVHVAALCYDFSFGRRSRALAKLPTWPVPVYASVGENNRLWLSGFCYID